MAVFCSSHVWIYVPAGWPQDKCVYVLSISVGVEMRIFHYRYSFTLLKSADRKIINTFTLADTEKLRHFTAFHGWDHSMATLIIMKYYKLSFNSFFQSRCCKRKLLTCLLLSVLINVKVLSCPTTEITQLYLKLCRFRPLVLLIRSSINLLKPTGHVMRQQFNIQQLYVLPTLYLCVLYLSENKERLVPLTA